MNMSRNKIHFQLLQQSPPLLKHTAPYFLHERVVQVLSRAIMKRSSSSGWLRYSGTIEKHNKVYRSIRTQMRTFVCDSRNVQSSLHNNSNTIRTRREYYHTATPAMSKYRQQQQQQQQIVAYLKPTVISSTASSLLPRYRPVLSLSSLSPSSTSFFNFFDLFAKIPKGFEDFFPNDEKDKNDTSTTTTKRNDDNNSSNVGNDDASKETNTEEDNSSASDSVDNKNTTTDAEKMHSSSSPPPPTPPPPNEDKKKQRKRRKREKDNSDPYTPEWTTLLSMLAMVMMLQYLTQKKGENADPSHGPEITYVEFRNQLLLPGLVERVVVLNDKKVIVHLKPNASNMASTSGTTMDNVATTASNETTFGDMSNDTLSVSSSSSNGNSKTYHFYIGSTEAFEEKLTKAQAAASMHPESWVDVQYVTSTSWTSTFVRLIPTFVTFIIFFVIGLSLHRAGGMFGPGGGRGGGPGGIFSIGKSPAKKIKKEDVSVTFADVAGCDEAKQEIMEFVDFLKDSSRFTKLGAKIPKGALLCGPPGTGKTLLAKAVAGEAGVPFYSISGSDFIEMFVGVGPSRVRDLFKEGRANAPCIIFIDEIDAVGRKRGQGGFRSGGNDERENTLNQLLVEMDGFSPTTGIVVLAGTNRVDILDEALTRPGRFDRQVQVDRPDLKGRKDIFKIHLKNLTLEGPIDDYAGRLAGLTPGFAGADIANICNEAAIVAARRKGESVSVADFEKATDRIIGGLESNKIMSENERRIVAHHEAGHAMAGWFLEHADPILKVTIIPRTSGALGFAQYLPKEVYLRSQEQIMDVVCMALAGRAAEEVFFGDVTTGASDDLRRVTELVYSTIKDFGMNSSVGQLAFPTNNDSLGDKPYSDSTAEAMDDEARRIVDTMYLRTVALIQKHKNETEKVANLLLKQETITHDDIVDLVGPRPFKNNSAYQEYVTNRNTYDTPKEEKKEDVEQNDSTGIDGLTPGFAMLPLKY